MKNSCNCYLTSGNSRIRNLSCQKQHDIGITYRYNKNTTAATTNEVVAAVVIICRYLHVVYRMLTSLIRLSYISRCFCTTLSNENSRSAFSLAALPILMRKGGKATILAFCSRFFTSLKDILQTDMMHHRAFVLTVQPI